MKAGQNALMPPPVGLPSGGGGGGSGAATQALLGDYNAAYKATPTPLRTPVQENIIMQVSGRVGQWASGRVSEWMTGG